MYGVRRLLPAALVGVVVAVLLGVTVVSAAAPEECFTSGASIGEAKTAYAANCSQPRVDCDPMGGTWYCSSRVIGAKAPGGATAGDVGQSRIGTDNGSTPAPSTTAPAPPTPAPEPEPTTTTAPPPTTDPVPTPTTAPPTTAPAPAATCNVITIEAETIGTTGAWKVVKDAKASGGSYLTWEGLSFERNNQSPADTMRVAFDVTVPGTYEFVWAMRQPGDVESDKANDSWVNFPDAARFGPTTGGSYGGPVKVFGNGKNNFAWKARADVKHKKSSLSMDFNSVGTYTMELSGRSHGHQIDKIVIYHSSVSQNDAIKGGACTAPAPTPAPVTTTTAPAPAPNPGSCVANTSGTANLAKDLISLQYDHAPDRDDGHATVAGREVATKVGFTPWVIGGAYGADNARTYREASEPVMDATWGKNGWINADDDWNGAVKATADRWQQTLQACGDVWIAEGGQSDLSADVVRELKKRMPGLDTEARIHLVQHSDWNERMALDADLAYAKANTDYIRIPDGNNGGNGTADLNLEKYNGPFINDALNGRHGAGWKAAFDYYSPTSARLDFSDTVELLHILGVGTNQVNGVEDFADLYIR
ncbi:MAG: hypothetical protein AAF962_01290 [Actinomycetota bacterium]